MNGNSWMVLKSNHCYQKRLMKSLVWQQKVLSALGGIAFVQWGLTFWNLNKQHCFIVFHISVWRGLELCFGWAKTPRGDGTA